MSRSRKAKYKSIIRKCKGKMQMCHFESAIEKNAVKHFKSFVCSLAYRINHVTRVDSGFYDYFTHRWVTPLLLFPRRMSHLSMRVQVSRDSSKKDYCTCDGVPLHLCSIPL